MKSTFKTKKLPSKNNSEPKILTVRSFHQADLDDVVSLLHELSEFAQTGSPLERETISDTFDEMARNPSIYQNIIAEINNDIVGLVSLVMYKTPFHTGGTALINELVIKSSYRGMGIGKHLIETAKEIAMERSMDELEVGTDKSNVDAQKFYKKCGFDEEFVLLSMEFTKTFSQPIGDQ